MEDVYALDFDGVICNSCEETILSAVKAAKARWPSLFDGVDSATEDWVSEQMRTLRPAVELGNDTLLLVRLLLEMKLPSIRKSSVAETVTVEEVVENWVKIKPVIVEEWNENIEELAEIFDKVRDEWVETDFKSWMGTNRIYPGVSDALKSTSSRIFVVTRNESRFVEAILGELAGFNIPPDRLFGLGHGPKVEVLKQLQAKPENQGMRLHFVEDRLATLKNVMKEPELDGWNLYLVEWGFNTQKERDEAASIDRIQLLQLPDFVSSLK